MAEHPLHQLVLLTRRLRDRLVSKIESAVRPWHQHREAYAERTGQTTVPECADAVALAAAGAALATQRVLTTPLPPVARTWLLAQSDPLMQVALVPCLNEQIAEVGALGQGMVEIRSYLADPSTRLAQCLVAQDARNGWDGLYFLEAFLQQYHASSRRRRGVYYTPVELATFLVRQVDQGLRTEFGCALGLADPATWQQVSSCRVRLDPGRPFVRTIDPAMGTGVFLLAAFDLMRETWVGQAADRARLPWNEFAASVVLPRLVGQDLMLSAVVVSRLLLTARLAESGYAFRHPGVLQLHCGNTLQSPRVGDEDLANSDAPFTVIWGNPPFSGLSEHRSAWIRDLLRGKAPGTPTSVASYFMVDGEPLAERKHWLDDDYVKFLRVAHWLIERGGCGVVGLVSNHGYLDNITFRGLRQQLLGTFSRVSVVDLHGNSRAGERAPDGTADESVFGIEQGVALCLLRCAPVSDSEVSVEHTDVWGAREDKLARLARHDLAPPVTVKPSSPFYLFVPRSEQIASSYLRGERLCDVMPLNCTAPVTARDGLVVAFTAAELHERLQMLADPQVSQEEIRQRFFPSPRSDRYPAGDTRGWQLSEARARLRSESDWSQFTRECQYRPFDKRWVFWAKWMVDWPRESVVRHLTTRRNVALVARRQVPGSHPCDYFWITDSIALDGLIRSDNRGSESLFPLYLASSLGAASRVRRAAGDGTAANFTPAFLQRMERQLGRAWCVTSTSPSTDTFSAWDLFCYIYALFHSPSYRRRYATWLRQDFPRVFVPASSQLFEQLSLLGGRLIALHLMRDEIAPGPSYRADSSSNCLKIAYPRWSPEGRIELAPHLSMGPVSRGTWEYRVGAYQVCQKWLKDRSGRTLTEEDLRSYARIVGAIDETRQIADQMDACIQLAGDWERAFV
jgi:hypothetical protein